MRVGYPGVGRLSDGGDAGLPSRSPRLHSGGFPGPRDGPPGYRRGSTRSDADTRGSGTHPHPNPALQHSARCRSNPRDHNHPGCGSRDRNPHAHDGTAPPDSGGCHAPRSYRRRDTYGRARSGANSQRVPSPGCTGSGCCDTWYGFPGLDGTDRDNYRRDAVGGAGFNQYGRRRKFRRNHPGGRPGHRPICPAGRHRRPDRRCRLHGVASPRGHNRHSHAHAASPGTDPSVPANPPLAPGPGESGLTAFYNALDGTNWKNRANWLSDAPLGEWHGITTRPDGRVSSISLNDNG